MAQLYINGKEIDLNPDTQIRMNYQVNELSEIQNRQAHFSTTFTAPFTINNTQILENAEQGQSTTNLPYELLDCQVLVNGIDVANGGKLYINQTNNGYNLNVYSGNISLFDELKTRSIRDLDLSEYDHLWTIEHIINEGTTKDGGYVYALCDYGPLSRPLVSNVDVRYLHNCFYVHTLIDKIFEESSFNVSGDILSDPFYKSLVLPVVDSKLQARRATEESQFEAAYLSTTVLTPSGNPSGSNIRFPRIVNDPQNSYSIATGELVLPNGFEGVVGANLDIKPYFYESDATFVFRVLRNGDSIAEAFVTQERALRVASEVTTFDAGDVISIVWEGQNPGDLLILKEGSSFFTDPNSDLVYRGKVNCEEILPDITQADLLKSVLQIFGGFIQTKRQTVSIATLKEISANRGSKNWSNKIIKKRGQKLWYISKNTRIGNYAQRNYFRYAQDSTVADGLGEGYFSINDATIKPTQNVLTLPFAASEGTDIFVSYDIGVIPKYTEYDTDSDTYLEEGKPKPRILFVDSEALLPPYTDGDAVFTPPNGSYVAYFESRTKANNLGFSNSIIRDWYGALVDLLTKAQKYTCYMNLQPSDVVNVEFFEPVYIEQASAWFMINKILDFTEGYPAKVEVIKL